MHSLVLVGNLQTAEMFNGLGGSTAGWSHVGQSLGGSLKSELDVLFGEVNEILTATLEKLLEVKAVLDQVVAYIGGETDAALLQVKDKTALFTFHNIAVKAASKEGWPGPMAMSLAHLNRSSEGKQEAHPKLLSAPNSTQSDDVLFMMETFRVNPPRLATMAHKLQTHSGRSKGLPPRAANDLEIIKFCMENPDQVGPHINAYVKSHPEDAKMAAIDAKVQATKWATDEIEEVIDQATDAINEQVFAFMEMIKPALLQVGVWLETFGTKVQTTVDGFTTALDKVQKIFDQVLSQVAGGEGLDQMLYDSFGLFDASQSGTVTASDLQDIGTVYGINALLGAKAEEFIQKYDADNSRSLDFNEYALFVMDPDIPGAMAVVLRAYAKKLSQIAGQVGAAKMRDEVAKAVDDWLTLTCSKNMTKVEWVSERLTNASIPTEFTADLLKNLAMDVDDPDPLFTIEPGPLLTKEMVRLNVTHIKLALGLMADPDFWISEGFDIKDQPKCVERVTEWVAQALTELAEEEQKSAMRLLFGQIDSSVHKMHSSANRTSMLLARPKMARQLVTQSARSHLAKQRVYRAQARAKLFQSKTAQVLFNELLGGSTAGSTTEDPEATMALNSGVEAAPETLEFAMWLSWNSSDAADTFQDQCMDYMGDSSSTLDSFATQVQTMIKKAQSFIDQMSEYSTPTGIEKLEGMVRDFIEGIEEQIKESIMGQVSTLEEFASILDRATLDAKMPSSAGGVVDDVVEVFVKTLDQLQAVLPNVIDNVKFAKEEISAIAAQLYSIFDAFEVKGPPILQTLSSLYGTMWKAYFIFFASLTFLILFYGFWATGWFGGPDASQPPEGYQPPSGIMEKCRMCCRSCSTCMQNCHDNLMCFWSCIIICEVIVLLLFIIAIALTLIGGIKAFLSAGCSTIYLIGDDSICTGILSVLKTFLATFWDDGPNALSNVCSTESLLTCQIISETVMTSLLYTTVGGMLAAILSFQMIVNTAQLHEQSRWVRIAQGFGKDDA
jgi:hypothetical protein